MLSNLGYSNVKNGVDHFFLLQEEDIRWNIAGKTDDYYHKRVRNDPVLTTSDEKNPSLTHFLNARLRHSLIIRKKEIV